MTDAIDRATRPNRAQMLLYYVASGFPISFLAMTTFLVPLRAQELGASFQTIGLIVGAGGVLGMLLAVPAGALADRFGPRRTFVLGAALNALAAFGLAAAEDPWLMLVVQLARGFPHSISWVASQTYATNVGTPAERAVVAGRFTFATGVGGLLAPLAIGAVAQLAGYRAGFMFVGGFALVHAVLGLGWKEVRLARARTTAVSGAAGGAGGFRAAGIQLRQRSTQVALLLTFIRLWINTGWSAFFPIFLVDRGFGPALIGTVMSANGVVSSVTGLYAHRLARRVGNEVATAGALALGALGWALSPHTAFVPIIYIPAALLGSGIGVSMPLVMVILGNDVPAERRGVAMGLRTTANQGANMVAPVFVGMLISSLGMVTGFLTSAVVAWVALGWAMWLHQRAAGRESG